MRLYPPKLLKPLLKYFRSEEKELKKRKLDIDSEDPFKNESRLNSNAGDDIDAAQKSGHQRSEVLGEETQVALGRVQKAMVRVKDGSYGTCVRCGNMIDTDRLGIDPTVELCINCAKEVSENK